MIQKAFQIWEHKVRLKSLAFQGDAPLIEPLDGKLLQALLLEIQVFHETHPRFLNIMPYLLEELELYSYGQKSNTFEEFFTNPSTLCFRPYLPFKIRTRLGNDADFAKKFFEDSLLTHGDVLHVPFTDAEIEVVESVILQQGLDNAEFDLSFIGVRTSLNCVNGA
jgi:hypothetical protein